MEPLSEPTDTLWSFPFTPQDWVQTPLAVQAYVRTLRDEVEQLHDRVETLEARLTQNSTTSSRPPSSDSPYQKPRRRTASTAPRKAGGKVGHPGHRQGICLRWDSCSMTAGTQKCTACPSLAAAALEA